MQNKEKQENLSKILYIVIIAVLCVTAVVIGITAAANRGNKTPIATTGPSTTGAPATTAPVTTAPPVTTPVAVLPELVAPAVGTVSKEHDLSTPVFSMTTGDWRTHTGIDIACSLGDAVYAAADGTVLSVASDPMMGTTVTISHAGDGVTIYKNLAATLPEGIKAGAKVIGGQVIGAVGETAISESALAAHLHFELTKDGAAVNPLDYLPQP